MLNDYGFEQGTMSILCDDLSAIDMSKNSVLHFKTKHIEIHHHFLSDLVEQKLISLEYIPIESQLTNIFTKPVDALRFEDFRKSLGHHFLD